MSNTVYPEELARLETPEDVILDIYRRLDTGDWNGRQAIVLEYSSTGWMATREGSDNIIECCKTMDEAARELWMYYRKIWECKK